jgi:osmotically-inducible protein OsmY
MRLREIITNTGALAPSWTNRANYLGVSSKRRSYYLRIAAFTMTLSILSPDYLIADPGVASPHRGPSQPQAYNRVVDRVLRGIRRELPDARYNIQVYDLDEVILLQGEVSSEAEKVKMASVARDVTSRRVRNELKVRVPVTDDEIALRVSDALSRDYPGVADRVTVSVRDGVAYLAGDLRNHREVDEILATALMVDGVKDIKSDVTLKGRPYRSGVVAGRRR